MDLKEKMISFKYIFTFNDRSVKEFTVNLDNETMCLIQAKELIKPDWARLKTFKCKNCTLDEIQHEFCPMVANLVDLIEHFKDRASIEEVDLLIEAPERKYLKHASLQEGLSSLIGIYMVTTGCPILEKLKPMVRYHLPFSTTEESIYRAASMYLLAQFFLNRKGKEPDWNLEKLVTIYSDIQVVNSNVCSKLRDVISNDAFLNALLKLDCSAFYVALRQNTKMLDEIETLFKAYLL